MHDSNTVPFRAERASSLLSGPGPRRLLIAALVSSTVVTVAAWMTLILARDGLSWFDYGMLASFVLTAPWVVLGFWNAVIGFAILHFTRDPVVAVNPLAASVPRDGPIEARTAILMPVYNEIPNRVFRHLRALVETLEDTDQAGQFELFLLSDTGDPSLAAEEERLFAIWQSTYRGRVALHYRRRHNNLHRKVGNLRDWCDRWGDRFKYMIVLDADSLMAGPSIVRLTRVMAANPELGILQSLPVGLPASSPFARVFQFGMRHAMRSFTLGSAWWQGDEGPYWGHNAVLDVAAYRAHCDLPVLPGRAPLGGEVLSHDQVEAAMMRGAGRGVRVLPDEGGSYEETPPTLLEFMRREFRWCQGNLQYFRLLGMSGLRPMGRVQLGMAIMMYLGAPLWLLFLILGFTQTFTQVNPPAVSLDPALAIGLFAVMMGFTFAPKVLGVIDILLRRGERKRYGPLPKVLLGSAVELVFSVLLAPVMTLALSLFIVSLLAGRGVTWDSQERDLRALPLMDALRVLWPQTLIGVLGTTALAIAMPGILPWAAPVLLGLVLAAPFAWLTSQPGLGDVLARLGLCATPEERDVPLEIQLLARDEQDTLQLQPVPPQPTLDQPVPVHARPSLRIGGRNHG